MEELTDTERHRLETIKAVLNNKITNEQASKELSITVRHLQRLKIAYAEYGNGFVKHRLKGKPSNKGYPKQFTKEIIHLYKKEYPGWNFCHFRDILEDEHNIKVSNSFIYTNLKKAKIKPPGRSRRRRKLHPLRPRRENAGELIQVDASNHPWFLTNGERFHLHGGIDDATGIVTACILQKEETTYGYQLVLKETIEKYGIPECLYTDYRTVFQSTLKRKKDLKETTKEIKATKFALMLEKLGTNIISTIDPMAKGRIERLWRTFQDRLVKELAKAHIKTIEEANQYIKEIFLPRYNARYASKIDYNRNVFVKVPPTFDYNINLALRSKKTVFRGCCIKDKGVYYKITRYGRAARIGVLEGVDLFDCLDGTKKILYDNNWYELEIIRPTENKERMQSKKERTKSCNSPYRPSKDHPWRKSNHIFTG